MCKGGSDICCCCKCTFNLKTCFCDLKSTGDCLNFELVKLCTTYCRGCQKSCIYRFRLEPNIEQHYCNKTTVIPENLKEFEISGYHLNLPLFK